MTNREFYAEQILDIHCSGNTVAVDKKTNKPCKCCSMRCSDCALKDERGDMCRAHFAEWCNAEYCPFKKDELVEVSNVGKYWELRYFSHIENGVYCVFSNQDRSNETLTTASWKYCRKYGTLGGLVKEDEK